MNFFFLLCQMKVSDERMRAHLKEKLNEWLFVRRHTFWGACSSRGERFLFLSVSWGRQRESSFSWVPNLPPSFDFRHRLASFLIFFFFWKSCLHRNGLMFFCYSLAEHFLSHGVLYSEGKISPRYPGGRTVCSRELIHFYTFLLNWEPRRELKGYLLGMEMLATKLSCLGCSQPFQKRMK